MCPSRVAPASRFLSGWKLRSEKLSRAPRRATSGGQFLSFFSFEAFSHQK